MRKLLLTGGHAGTTAMAVVEEILRRGGRKDTDIYWIGVKSAFEGSKIPSLESDYLLELNVKSNFVYTGRLQRKFTRWTIPAIFKIPIGFFQSLFLLLKIKPQAVLSFGGFASFPVIFWAKFIGVPVIIHEQTAAAGRANLFGALFASKIALSRKQSLFYFPAKRVVLTGNPVMTQVWEVPFKEKKSNPPVIYITGGSRGSVRINDAILGTLEPLLHKYYLIHQTGRLDFERVRKARDSLDNFYKDRYEIYPVIDPMQIDGVYRRADIIVSRAGANTVSEIMVVKRPSILIPIPFSYLDEQTKNAEVAVRFGISVILPERELSPSSLRRKIEQVDENWYAYVKRVRNKESPDKNAARLLVDLLEAVAKR